MAAVVVPGPPSLHPDFAHALSLYYTTDPLLSNAPVLVLYGPASTIGATSSRIQVHIFTAAGVATYARLAVSPNSPFYTAVSNLPREEQGDEVCRGLAFSLRKCFAELSQGLRDTWCTQAKAPSPSALFGDDHVAILATRMSRVENVDAVTAVLAQTFAEQRQSWQDVDVVLPPGSIKPANPLSESDELTDAELLELRYGRYSDLIASLGDRSFLPTSKLKRAPSKASVLGRSLSFLKHQKENARKELRELLETEESYVERVQELQQFSTTLGPDLKETARSQLRSIFPSSLGAVLDVNSGFCAQLRSIVQDSEDVSLQDIDGTSEIDLSTHRQPDDSQSDVHGIIEVAKCLCEWLIKFSGPYSGYLSEQADCAQLLRGLLRSSDTALAAELHGVGEQRLTSLLIEPVQRLPRYNLYVDGITKQLPVRHPAIKHFLKARDLISEICSQNGGGSAASKIVERLSARVSDWPADISIHGRLTTAADFVLLQPPFTLDANDSQPGLLLLFTDCIVLLEKSIKTSINARVLMTELESGLPVHRAERANTPTLDLHFLNIFPLADIDFTEGNNGRVLHVYTRFEAANNTDAKSRSILDSCLVLKLENTYDGKAPKLAEEMVKARVEGRFSETERESPNWEVRASDPVADHCCVFSAVFDDSNAEHLSARVGRACVRVLVDLDRHSHKPRAGDEGIRTLIALSPLKDGLWRMTVESLDLNPTREHVPAADLAIVLSKRLASLTASRLAIDHPTVSSCLLAHNTAALQLLDLEIRHGDEDEPPLVPERPKRSRSPVKLLSSFLSSTGPGAQSPILLGKNLPPLPPPSHSRNFGSLSGRDSKPSSREGRPGSRDAPLPMVRMRANAQAEYEVVTRKLEDTLGTYLLALQARKGNIVGRNLKMRATADELAVNELYNKLLEDPNMMVLAAQESVDVLFAAFEKFLNIAWKDGIGQILSLEILQEIQTKAETLFPADFDDFFRRRITTLVPENQRAFKCIMKLLADLLDGTGNDGDRGMLTAAFAEVLITEGNPHDFIPLIDRFVDDTDTYFGEPLEDVQRSIEGALVGHKRARSLNSSSITSNTSSFRRKLGFSTLSRANSKSEDESKMSAVWRSLSKSTRPGEASPAGSISKASLNRTHSIGDNQVAGKRPTSRDGPVNSRADGSIGPATCNLGLSTIGEHPSFIPTGPPRKKRRSSLSDLTELDVSQQASPFQSPAAMRPTLLSRISDEKTLLPSPISATPSANSNPRMGSPSRGSPRSRLPASFKREASPGPAQNLEAPDYLTKNDDMLNPLKLASGIPKLTPRTTSLKAKTAATARSGLSERPNAGNIVKKPTSSPEKARKLRTPAAVENISPRKLKMQSPQKLRERLQNEQAAISTAHTSLQDELTKIGDELTATIPQQQNFRTTKSTGRVQAHGSMDLAQRVLKMEGALPQRMDEINANVEQIRTDLTTSLSVSETKCKKLDQLYREANSENEALYAQFNEELSRILRAVRGGEGVDELRKQLKESQEETAKLRRETDRLKRENVGLRAQLKE